jgi:hypothetical protein
VRICGPEAGQTYYVGVTLASTRTSKTCATYNIKATHSELEEKCAASWQSAPTRALVPTPLTAFIPFFYTVLSGEYQLYSIQISDPQAEDNLVIEVDISV